MPCIPGQAKSYPLAAALKQLIYDNNSLSYILLISGGRGCRRIKVKHSLISDTGHRPGAGRSLTTTSGMLGVDNESRLILERQAGRSAKASYAVLLQGLGTFFLVVFTIIGGIDTVQVDITRALSSAQHDPEDAVTAACSLIEAVCCSILIELKLPLPPKKDIEGLIRAVQEPLGLSARRMAGRDRSRHTPSAWWIDLGRQRNRRAPYACRRRPRS